MSLITALPCVSRTHLMTTPFLVFLEATSQKSRLQADRRAPSAAACQPYETVFSQPQQAIKGNVTNERGDSMWTLDRPALRRW